MGNSFIIHTLHHCCASTRRIPRRGTQPVLSEGMTSQIVTNHLITLTHWMNQGTFMDGARPSDYHLTARVCFLVCSAGCERTFSVYQWPKVSVINHLFVSGKSHYISRRAVRMGQHVWLLLATIITELLVIMKWSKGQFSEPFPTPVKWGWAIGVTLLTIYPTVQVSLFLR